MTKKLSNLDKIIAASKGYSCKINGSIVIQIITSVISLGGRVVLMDGSFIPIEKYPTIKNIDDFEITGYVYVGHLFGEPEITEGQRFRVRGQDKVINGKQSELFPSFISQILKDIKGNPIGSLNNYDKQELEPVFE